MWCKTSFANRIGDVMARVFAPSDVDHAFEPRSGQTKEYKIGICCYSAKHAALKNKSKDWFAHNQDSVSEWSDMSKIEMYLVIARSISA
jgi:hypothetical protein